MTNEERETLDDVVVRFAGDSGDGMQLTGTQFASTAAVMGNDLATFPDFPSEIRAPQGSLYGVSGFQVHFSSQDIRTPGDDADVLVAMNPAALQVNLASLKRGGLLVLNTDAFTAKNLAKAGFEANPTEDGSLDAYRLLPLPIGKLSRTAVAPFGLKAKGAERTKNMWTLGLMYWLFGRERQPTIDWLRHKFAKKPEIAEANVAALNAGHIYGENAEMPHGIGVYRVPKAEVGPGTYRNVNGNEALAWGLTAGAQLAGLSLFYGSYPITPASTILHGLAKLKAHGVTTFQAEDEIAAVCAALGASYGGALGVTGTSGPGVALKTEAIGLAVATELPLVVVDVQRGGPSTGLPTKTEQSDLFQAVFGRNGDAPLIVLAARSPGDCFDVAIEAVRLATRFMTPVMLLSDGYIANGAEPWRIPSMKDYAPFPVEHRQANGAAFAPYARDPETLARAWAVPGTPGLMHRLGGLERDATTGHISVDPDNHHEMTSLRARKVRGARDAFEAARLDQGDASGDLLFVGWGSTFGAISQATRALRAEGARVGHLHLRHLWPLPRGLGEVLDGYGTVLIPELNGGMLETLLRAELGAPIRGYHKVAGQPFRIAELVAEAKRHLDAPPGDSPITPHASAPLRA